MVDIFRHIDVLSIFRLSIRCTINFSTSDADFLGFRGNKNFSRNFFETFRFYWLFQKTWLRCRIGRILVFYTKLLYFSFWNISTRFQLLCSHSPWCFQIWNSFICHLQAKSVPYVNVHSVDAGWNNRDPIVVIVCRIVHVQVALIESTIL